MSLTQFDTALQRIHEVASAANQAPDAVLLRRFHEARDEAAFATLVRRHGRMVLGVCRQVLGHEQDAEDAFQATFLVLAQNAGSIRKQAALPAWLYGVAYRVAAHAARAASRRRAHERKAETIRHADTHLDLALRELQAILADEVARLPAKFRAPFVLCCLEGKSKAEAAAQLGWKEGTVSARLAEARARMRQRLTRRGLTLPAVLCAGALVSGEALAVAPALVKMAIRNVAGSSGDVSTSVRSLVEGVSRGMRATRIRKVALLMTTAALLSAGIVLGWRLASAEARTPSALLEEPGAQPAEPAGEVFTYAGRVLGPDGTPRAGAKILLCGLTPGVIEFRARATSGPDGTFRFTVRRDEFGNKGVVPPSRSPPERFVHIGALAEGCGAACVWAGTAEEREKLKIWLPAEEVVKGRVIDTEGKPVAGVNVWTTVRGTLADAEYRPLSYDSPGKTGHYSGNILPDDQRTSAVSDKDGRFELHGLGHGWLYNLYFRGPTLVNTTARLVARPQKAGVAEASGIVPPNRPPPQVPFYGSEFTHVVLPCKPIRGMVREKGSGKPLAGVEVLRAWTRDDDPEGEATSDKDGRYTLTGLPPGIHVLQVRPAPGTPYVESQVRVVADQPGFEPVAFDVELERRPAVRGRVTDRTTGKPVKAWVEYRPLAKNPNLAAHPTLAEPRLGNHPPTTSTDADGRFFLAVIPGPGVLLVRAEADYLPATLRGTDRGADITDKIDPELIDCRPLPAFPGEYHAYGLLDAAAGEVDFALTPGRTRSLVVEYPDGKARDTTVLGLKPPALDHGGQYVPGKTDVVALSEEPRRLFLSTADRKLAATVTVNNKETGPVTVQLKPTGTMTGRVVDHDGKPIEGATFQVLSDDGVGRPGVFVQGGWVTRIPTEAESRRSQRTSGFLDNKVLSASTEGKTDDQGRFRLTGILPEAAFELRVSLLSPPNPKGQRFITGFRPLTRGTVKPGEVLDLGELRATKMDEK